MCEIVKSELFAWQLTKKFVKPVPKARHTPLHRNRALSSFSFSVPANSVSSYFCFLFIVAKNRDFQIKARRLLLVPEGESIFLSLRKVFHSVKKKRPERRIVTGYFSKGNSDCKLNFYFPLFMYPFFMIFCLEPSVMLCRV